MDLFNRAKLKALVELRQQPCVTVYTATHRSGTPEDIIRFKEQLNEVERRLIGQGMRSPDVKEFLAPARAYIDDADFWKKASDGLVLFLAPGTLQVYRLPLQFANQVFVGKCFHVKPLLQWVSDDGRYYILAISQNHTRLLEATAHSVHRLKVHGLPESEAEARKSHDRDESLQFHAFPAPVGQSFQAVFNGQGVGIDDYKDEIFHYFQEVDRAIHHKLSNERSPLILATVEYIASIYRKANKYPQIIDSIVKGNPDRVTDQELHDKAWPQVAPLFKERAERALGRFRQLAGTGRTTNNIQELLPAARRGEIDMLFVVGKRDAWGKYDPESDKVQEMAADQEGAEDLVNLAVTYALSHDRQVHAVEPDAAFTGAAVAGTYFAPMNKHGK
jgi:hypothetical protein